MPDQDTNDNELDLDIIEDEPESDTQITSRKAAEGEEKIELSLSQDKTQVAKTLSPAEAKAKEQELSFFNRILEGEIEMKDVPKWLQPRVQLRLDTVTKADDIRQIAREMAREEIERRNEDAEFNKLRSQIPQMTKAEANSFQEKFNKFKPLGKVEALRETMEIFGYGQESKENAEVMKSRSRMSLPKVGQSIAKENSDLVELAKDEKKWNAHMRKMKESEA